MRKSKEELLKLKLEEKDKEIASLKKELNKTIDELDLARLSKEMLLVETDKMVADCENKLREFNSSIEEINKLREQYTTALNDMKDLKKEQKNNYKQLIKKIRKR